MKSLTAGEASAKSENLVLPKVMTPEEVARHFGWSSRRLRSKQHTRMQSPKRPQIRLALTPQEVAVALDIAITSIDQMVNHGILPPPRIWHKRRFWLVSELQASFDGWPPDLALTDDWPDSVSLGPSPLPNLSWRERSTLEQIGSRKGGIAHHDTLRDCGPTTIEGLCSRGYLRPHSGTRSSISGDVELTDAGRKLLADIKAETADSRV